MLKRFLPLATLLAVAPVASARLIGIDVSRFQNTIDWDTVAAQPDVAFAFIKATEGAGFRDPAATRNIAGADRVGIPLGVYHFARPYTNGLDDSRAEADWFVSQAGGVMIEGFLPPVLDMEVGRGEYSRRELSVWAKSFLDRVEDRTGTRPLVYASETYAEDLLDATLLQTDLWVANYTRSPDRNPTDIRGWPDGWLFHQYTDQRVLRGVTGNTVDSNVFDGDLADLDALRFRTAVPEPAGLLALAGLALLGRRRRPAA